MKIKFNPCPFCGSEDILDNYDDTVYSKTEITDRVLESSVNEIIEFTDIL